MQCINIFQAKTTFSKLVESIENGREQEIVIARNGKPVARLSPVVTQPVEKRLGVAKGKFVVPDDIDADNETVLRLFVKDKS
jgi:antitoxin (DNA-binding transcriptional repressor) of toxin-antitoxin stability system